MYVSLFCQANKAAGSVLLMAKDVSVQATHFHFCLFSLQYTWSPKIGVFHRCAALIMELAENHTWYIDYAGIVLLLFAKSTNLSCLKETRSHPIIPGSRILMPFCMCFT